MRSASARPFPPAARARRPRVHAPGREIDFRHARRRGGPQDGADIPRVLDVFEHHARSRRLGQRAPARCSHDRENAARRRDGRQLAKEGVAQHVRARHSGCTNQLCDLRVVRPRAADDQCLGRSDVLEKGGHEVHAVEHRQACFPALARGIAQLEPRAKLRAWSREVISATRVSAHRMIPLPGIAMKSASTFTSGTWQPAARSQAVLLRATSRIGTAFYTRAAARQVRHPRSHAGAGLRG